jgi:predicted AAA+ superfamily ATPase
MKLGSKSPDLRYQSASGLRHDLTVCINHIKHYKIEKRITTSEWIDNSITCEVLKAFHSELGSNDLSGKLEVYNDTVGREEEYALLHESYTRVSNGESRQEVCIISGAFGIGKSDIVKMLHCHIADENHFFGISSKFLQASYRNV